MITAINLTKTFDGKKALDGVSFTVDEGLIYGLVGSNGSGKSTLLRLISGVYYPDGGKIGIDGVNSFNNPEIKSKIIFLGDTPYFLPQSNLKEMARLYSGMYESFSFDTYNELLKIFPLDERARLSTFSKGMQRQAAIILAMAARPKYLLLDEAFDGLDVVMRRVLANLIIEGVENRGMTTIISSHNLRELEDICDHLAVIHNGKMVLSGSTDELQAGIHKIQMAFSSIPEKSVFEKLDLVKIEQNGSVLQLVARGKRDEIMKYIENFSPIFAECIEPGLEELFVLELEGMGYDVKNILE